MSLLGSAPIVAFYNGVVFPTETDVVEASARPMPDSAGRAVKYVHYSITLSATIATANQLAGQTTDTTLASLRRLLTAYAGEFHLDFAGFGPLAVNCPGGVPTVGLASAVRDCVWGPKPALLRWKPLGQLAAEVTWSVDLAVVECPPPLAANPRGILEWCFSVGYEYDQSGYGKRTYKGHIVIPQTRATVGARNVPDSVDRLKESVNPPLIPGFRRISGTWDISEDKCRADWSVTDVEIGPNYPPPGVVEVSLEQGATTGKPPAGFGGQWFGSLRGTYEVARDVPRSAPYTYFLAVLIDRIKQAQATPFVLPQGGKQKKNAYLIWNFSISEPEIHGRRCASFAATWMFYASLQTIVKASGMWRPVPNSDWQRWAASLAGTAFNARGNARLRFDPAGDALVDLCQPNNPTLRGQGLPPEPALQHLRTQTLKNPLPPPETSWIYFVSTFRLEQIDQIIALQPLPSIAIDARQLERGPTAQGSPPADYSLSTAGGSDFIEAAKPAPTGGLPASRVGTLSVYPETLAPAGNARGSPALPVVQVRAAPAWYAYLEGFAVRGGYPIAPPTLLEVGGSPVVPCNRGGNGFRHWEMDCLHGLPIHACTWNLRYLVVGRPDGDIPIMETPFGGH